MFYYTLYQYSDTFQYLFIIQLIIAIDKTFIDSDQMCKLKIVFLFSNEFKLCLIIFVIINFVMWQSGKYFILIKQIKSQYQINQHLIIEFGSSSNKIDMSGKKIISHRNPSQALIQEQIERIKQDNNQLNEKVKLLKQELFEALKSKQKYKSKYKILKQKFETLQLLQQRFINRVHSRDSSNVQHQNLMNQKQKSQQNPYQMHQQKQYKHAKQTKLIRSQSNLETNMTNSLRNQYEQKEYIKICKQVSSVNLKIQKIEAMLNIRLEKQQQRARQDRKQIIDFNDRIREEFTKQLSEIKKLLQGLSQATRQTLNDNSMLLQSQLNNNNAKKQSSTNNIRTCQTLNEVKDKSKIFYRTPKNTRQDKKDIKSQKKMLMNFGKQLLNFKFNSEDSQNQAH